MRRVKFDVTTLGETMLRLSPPNGVRLSRANYFNVTSGGAESNVCAALASLGRTCGWISRVPDGALGDLLLHHLRAYRIDTSRVALAANDRLGVYYFESAKRPLSGSVIYDRSASAMSKMTSADVDWSYLLDSKVIHLTGITAALGDNCRALLHETISRARAANVKVTFDVNFRSKLWSTQEACRTLLPLIKDVDLLICSLRDASSVFGLPQQPQTALQNLIEMTDAASVVLTLGEKGAIGFSDQQIFEQPSIPAEIAERLGAGDAFAAGVIDGLLDGSMRQGLTRGVALAAIALSQTGDMVSISRKELESLLHQDTVEIER